MPWRLLFPAALACLALGCTAIPERLTHPLYHNPFPQLEKVAIVPFFNQSQDPTLNGDEVALAYYEELQQIQGFEVVPVGVVKQAMAAANIQARDADEIRRLGLMLDVDAVVVGSITDFSQYYPPRMGLAVDWYAVNPSFHPIPAGYGLPWGTPAEKEIPRSIVVDAEFALAREQLKTQTPPFQVNPEVLAPPPARLGPVEPSAPADSAEPEELPAPGPRGGPQPAPMPPEGLGPTAGQGPLVQLVQQASAEADLPPAPAAAPSAAELAQMPLPGKRPHGAVAIGPAGLLVPEAAPLPSNWPDPRGFVPRPPCPERPAPHPQREPVMSLIRLYDGHDSKFTECLANYYEFRDDARFGGWQSYLQRKQDFVRFCCYMHITEMLAARGGTTEKRIAWRWPISRYFR